MRFLPRWVTRVFLIPIALTAVTHAAHAQIPKLQGKQLRTAKPPEVMVPNRGSNMPMYEMPTTLASWALPSWISPVFGVVIAESEPNDNASLAQLVSLGDTSTGVIDPAGDADFFAIDLTAGTTVDFDVDAADVGSGLDPFLILYDRDSVTVLAYNDDFQSLDSRLIATIPADGRYFVEILPCCSFEPGPGGPNYTYLIRFGTFAVDEIEPNDVSGEATALAVGDTVFGILSPASDVDYFAIDVVGPTLLEAELQVGFMEWFEGELTLFDTDGVTELASVNVFQSFPPTVREYLATDGTYYVAVRAVGDTTVAANRLYAVRTDTRAPGSGDLTTLFATGLGEPYAMVAAPNGDLVLLDWMEGLRRVDLSGNVTTVPLQQGGYEGLAIDGFGNVLLSGWDFQTGWSSIFQVSAAGDQTVLISDSTWSYSRLTVGPDGDIWVGSCGSFACPALLRLDPVGNPKDTIVTPFFPYDLAFSPSGDLHFTDGGTAVYRLSGGSVQPVVEVEPHLEGLAFDEDGYLYVANGFLGMVLLFSPTYDTVEAPFAVTNLGGPINLAFGRDASGATTSRLFASNGGFVLAPPYRGGIVETNPDGMRASGWSVGASLLSVAAKTLRTGSIAADYADTLTVVDPPGTVSWSIAAGELPPGIALGTSSGVISGVPSDSGWFVFTVRVDSDGEFGFGRFEIAIDRPAVALKNAADALLGVPELLTPELERFLDIEGNNNGKFDIGDMRAYLIRQGQLASPAAVSKPERNEQ